MLKATAVFFLAFFALGCESFGSKGNQRFFAEKRWTRFTLAKEHVGSRRQHRFSPILTSDLIVQANSIDGLVAYDRESAKEKWRLRIFNGVESSAALSADNIYFGAGDGFFYSVRVSTGQVNWSYPIRAEGLGTPTIENGVVYFLAGNNVLHALDAQTGKLIWVYTRRDSSNLSIRGGSQPSLSGEFVYAGFSDGSLVALKKSSGVLFWEVSLNRNKRFRDVDSQPILSGEKIYVSSYDGALYCLNKNDGRIIWSYEDGGEDAPLLVGDKLYYSTSSGNTVAIDKDSGKEIWKYQNKNGIATQPSIFKDLLLVGEMKGELLFLDINTGKMVANFAPGWGVSSRPIVDSQKNEAYFMSAGANLYSLRLAWRRYAQLWPWEEL